MPTKVATLRLDEGTLERVEILARAENRTVSAELKQLIEAELERRWADSEAMERIRQRAIRDLELAGGVGETDAPTGTTNGREQGRRQRRAS